MLLVDTVVVVDDKVAENTVDYDDNCDAIDEDNSYGSNIALKKIFHLYLAFENDSPLVVL